MPFLAFLHLDFSFNQLGNTGSNGLQKISNLNELTRLTINLNRLYNFIFERVLIYFLFLATN